MSERKVRSALDVELIEMPPIRRSFGAGLLGCLGFPSARRWKPCSFRSSPLLWPGIGRGSRPPEGLEANPQVRHDAPGCWKQERVNQRKLPQALLRSVATLCAMSSSNGSKPANALRQFLEH